MLIVFRLRGKNYKQLSCPRITKSIECEERHRYIIITWRNTRYIISQVHDARLPLGMCWLPWQSGGVASWKGESQVHLGTYYCVGACVRFAAWCAVAGLMSCVLHGCVWNSIGIVACNRPDCVQDGTQNRHAHARKHHSWLPQTEHLEMRLLLWHGCHNVV